MRKKTGEGTKIAQAAKELGVTSVTIRRYITEFNIETTADDNGIKVLPSQAMEELQEIRKLKEEGLTNPKVMEILEESRAKSGPAEKPKAKEKEKEKAEPAAAPKRVTRKVAEAAPAAPIVRRKAVVKVAEENNDDDENEAAVDADGDGDDQEASEQAHEQENDAESKGGDDEHDDDAPIAITSADGKSKYSLTCQTCQKTFEHMNPRLRDCLDCYRIKRKERRRGGDKHKNVIQNPLAQQVVSKNQQAQMAQQSPVEQDEVASISAPLAIARVPEQKRPSLREQLNFAPVGTTPSVYQRTQVRSYRKAIEETRGITSNLKRRLERPDLPEAERRFLEQIYAYQLILHQGWKHLAEYRQGDTGSSGGSKHES